MNQSTRFAASLWGAAALILSTATVDAAGDPPESPLNLQGVIVDDEVTLSWDVPMDDDGVRGYNVYVDNLYRDTVLDNFYSGPVVADTLTSFSVVAFDSAPRQFSASSEELVLPESLIPSDLTIPPSTPLNLAGEIAGTQVTIQWSPSTDDEAVLGYNVYRDNIYVTTVSEPLYTSDIAEDEINSWHVVAFDIRRNFSARSERIRLPDPGPVDTTIAPTSPGALIGEVTAGTTTDTVQLSWVESTDDQAVAGYNIYVNGDYSATRFGTEFTIELPAGSSNTFKVTAFDFDKNFSTSSDSLILPADSAPVDTGVPPSRPTGLSASTSNGSGETIVILEWEPSISDSTVKGYNVYRDKQYLTTVRANTFTDTLSIGTPASYAVVAFDNFENYSLRSERVNVLGAINQAPFLPSLDDQQILADRPWEFLLSPVDVDDDPAGLSVSELPSGMLLIDNLDGTRSLTWEPSIENIGEYEIEVTVFDLRDPAVSTTQTFKVIVEVDASSGQSALFSIQVEQAAFNLVEGDEQGISIPIVIERTSDFETPITLGVEARTAEDANGMTTLFSDSSLEPGNSSTTLSVQLAIGNAPLLPEQRTLIITATADGYSQQSSVTLAVTPVALDDVYLLIGQSNMVGFSENDAKRAGPGEPDEPNQRIMQLNPVRNTLELITDDPAEANVFHLGVPLFEPAEDPLHSPADPVSGRKSGSRIGMGLSFAKTALPNTTRNIILVPAAWSGSSFCASQQPYVQWNIGATDNPELGNTLLFDRALARVNETLEKTGGILRGILWHQGENDGNRRCAEFYEDNLIQLVQTLRTQIVPDARGADARGPAADIPFVVGTMSKGSDADSDYAEFSPSKTIVDTVHRSITSLVPFSAVTNNDDLTPDNGFPCGSSTCIHFGAAALREMGARTYHSLKRAASTE